MCVCVCVCGVCEEFFLTDIVLEGVVKVLETSQTFPTPVCKLLQWSWKCLKLPNPSVQTFLLEAGNVSRFPIPVGNLFQWMLEMSQGSAAAIFFSGCWKFLKLPHLSVQTFSLDAGNVSSFPTPVWKLFQWMLEMSQASPPQCANFFS